MSNVISLEYLESIISKSAGGRFVIPFASTRAPQVSCGTNGAPANVAPLGFGFAEADYTVPISSTGLIDLTGTSNNDRQFSFSVPIDCIVENIYMNAGPWAATTIANGQALLPFIELYWVPPANNIFMPLADTKTEPVAGFTGSVTASQMLSASKLNIGTKLPAGSRVMIVGHIETTGSGNLSNSQYMYFTGGISFTTESLQSNTNKADILCAQNTEGSLINVLVGGAAVPLNSVQYNSGFIQNGNQFTVLNAGIYKISYRISVTAGLLLNSGIYINGTEIDSLTRSPAINLSEYICESVLSLAVNDNIQLTLFGLLGTAILQAGVGANLIVTKLA